MIQGFLNSLYIVKIQLQISLLLLDILVNLEPEILKNNLHYHMKENTFYNQTTQSKPDKITLEHVFRIRFQRRRC